MRRARFVLFLLLLAASGCDSDEKDPPRPAGTTVSVNVDSPVVTRGSMNGFIHSLSATEPADALVAPLAPRLWRSDLLRAPPGRATALGASYQVVLSDLWGYPANGWNGRGPPWADLGAWERFVRRLAREHRGQPVGWDIWNEPDGPTFWSGGRARFFRTYAVANRVLREELGTEVEIAGPSVSRWSPVWIEAFLDHCLAARCRISALTWHENLRPGDPIAGISQHLREGRSRFLDDPRYAALGVKEIHVNEYVGRAHRSLPGEAVAYLAELEEGGADLAARSCWSEADCAPAALGGLLDPGSGAPRAVWWAHRWYAQGAGARVRSAPGDDGVFVLASRPGAGEVQVLLGRVGSAGVGVELAVSGLPASGTARFTVDRVSGTGDRAARPERLRGGQVGIEDGRLRLSVPELGGHEAALITLVF